MYARARALRRILYIIDCYASRSTVVLGCSETCQKEFSSAVRVLYINGIVSARALRFIIILILTASLSGLPAQLTRAARVSRVCQVFPSGETASQPSLPVFCHVFLKPTLFH